MSGKVTVKTLNKLKLVWFKGEGQIHLDQIIEEVLSLYKTPGFSGSFDTFLDMGEISPSPLTEDFNDKFGWFFQTLEKREPPRRWVIFAKHEEAVKTANLIGQMMNRNVTVQVFQKRDQALECLGVSAQALLAPPCG